MGDVDRTALPLPVVDRPPKLPLLLIWIWPDEPPGVPPPVAFSVPFVQARFVPSVTVANAVPVPPMTHEFGTARPPPTALPLT